MPAVVLVVFDFCSMSARSAFFIHERCHMEKKTVMVVVKRLELDCGPRKFVQGDKLATVHLESDVTLDYLARAITDHLAEARPASK
jgi:hypothetical protein